MVMMTAASDRELLALIFPCFHVQVFDDRLFHLIETQHDDGEGLDMTVPVGCIHVDRR
jgi:hypothetical protein